jgi:hypothetical protein
MSSMSEVVPLPSFGEVFFDERGQERVLRVTWHEGTLVLSLWRGEMCTASFRMPMDDVGRLVDTLDEGFVEAGGQYPDEAGEPAHMVEHQVHGEFPATGQYARPRSEDYAQPPQPYADPVGHAPPLDEPRQVATLGPNDVLVARGTAAQSPDRSQDRMAAYGTGDAVPRENMIVGDALPYGQSAGPLGSGEPMYQMPGDRYPTSQPDPYGASQGHQDLYGAPDPYGASPDPYGTPGQQPDAFATPGGQPDPYGVSPQQPVDPFTAPVGRQPVDPFAAHADQFPASAHQPHADPYTPQGQQHSTDPFGFAAQQQQQQPAYQAQPDPYGYPAPAQPDLYAFGAQQPGPPQSPQAGHPADLRDLYGAPPAYQQQNVDPSDPLGLRGQQPEQLAPRPYIQEPSHATGERLRPEQRYDEQRYDDRRLDDQGYDDRRDGRDERREGRRRDERDERRDW